MWSSSGFLFCSVCGGHAYRYPAPKLLKTCQVVPVNAQGHHLRRHLRLMHAGKHPESKRFIGVAKRLFASTAHAERAGTYGRAARARVQVDSSTEARAVKNRRVDPGNNISPSGLASHSGPDRGSNSSRPTAACPFHDGAPEPKRPRSDHRTGTDYG